MDGRNSKLAITAGLVGLIVAASVAMAMGHTSSPPNTSEAAPPPPAIATADKLGAELDQCNRLGPNDKPDQSCLDAWAEARRHFLGGRP